MPQSIFDDNDNGLTIASDCRIIPLPLSFDVGAGLCQSYAYPEYAEVYNFECYSGSPLCRSWCPKNEARFACLMAFAAAIRWDSYNLLEECYRSTI